MTVSFSQKPIKQRMQRILQNKLQRKQSRNLWRLKQKRWRNCADQESEKTTHVFAFFFFYSFWKQSERKKEMDVRREVSRKRDLKGWWKDLRDLRVIECGREGIPRKSKWIKTKFLLFQFLFYFKFLIFLYYVFSKREIFFLLRACYLLGSRAYGGKISMVLKS